MGPLFKKASFCFALPFALLSLLAAQTPTTTTLSVGPANYVAAGTVVTLTATVANPGIVSSGSVNFCNTSFTDCSPGSGQFGTAELTSAGTATLRMVFGYGVNQIKAVFLPTNSNAGSASLTTFVTVGANPIYTNTPSISASGTPGSYTLSGTVTAFGIEPLGDAPINFIDTTSGNTQIGTATLSLAGYIQTQQPAISQGWSSGTNILSCDVNGDGIPDLALNAGAVWPATIPGINIYIGNGDGTFQSAIVYAPGSNGVAWLYGCGDFNGDGKADLLVTVATGTGNFLAVALGNGDGTFQSPTTSLPKNTATPANGAGGDSVAIGDFNGDGKLDAIGGGYVVFGNGDGTFTLGPSNSYCGVPAVGDFNGDGKLDVACIFGGWPSTLLAIQLGKGDGTFQPANLYPLSEGNTFSNLAVADFNGDGKLDVVVSGGFGNSGIEVFLGNGDGSLQSPILYAVGSDVGSVVVADFNHDSKPDIAFADLQGGKVYIMLGKGDGTFQPPVTYFPTSTYLWNLVAPDFNGDGIPDLAVASYDVEPGSISIFLGEQVANYTQGGIAAIGTGTQYVDASYPGDATRLPSQSATVPLIGTTLPTQTIIFAPIVSPVTFGVSPIALSATGGSSGNPVTFTASGPGYVNTTNNTLVVTGVGTIVVFANQLGNAGYSAAPQVSQSVQVIPATPPISPLSCSPNPITYGAQNSTCTTSIGGGATGSVSFFWNGNLWATVPVSAGTASASGFAWMPVGTYSITAYYSGDANNNGGNPTPTTLQILKAGNGTGYTLSWGPLPNMTYGAPLGPAQLNATSTIPGTFAYTPPAGTLLPVGSYLLNATFTPTDSADYNSGAISAPLTVVKVTTSIDIFCTPNTITYGSQTTTCTAAISPLATGAVNFSYNGTSWGAPAPIVGGMASITGLNNTPAGSYNILVNYGGDSNFNPTNNSTTVTITLSQTAVTLSCSPTSFVLGSTTTCTATAPAADGTVAFYSTADLTGKWWNSPYPAGGGDLGSAPVATTQDGSLNYNVTGYPWPNAASAPAGVATTSIYARWTGTFVSPVDGTYTIGVNSDDGANIYVNGTLLVGNLSAGQGAGANLAYTQSGQIQLSAGATNTIIVEYEQGGGGAGIQLLWTPPGASSASLLGWTVVPVNAGGQASITGGSPWSAGTYNVTAAYSGDANYSATISSAVPVTVTQATPTVTVTCSPSTMVFGSTTSCTAHISGGTGTVTFTGGSSQPGPWVQTVDGSGNAVLSGFSNWQVGTYTIQATYSGDSNYNVAMGSTTLTVTPSSSGLTWATPAPITYGTPLSSAQLDATTGSVPGTFAYSPAAGTILPAGNQTLSVTFTPLDNVDYSTQTTTVTLLVNKAFLTVTPNPAIRVYGGANPVFPVSITGLVAGDSITASCASAATVTTPVGVYSSGPNAITCGLSDPGGKSVNYAVTNLLGTLTITQATPTVTWATPAPITYGTPLSGVQLNATSNGVAGTFAYTPTAGTILTPGAWPMSVIFTPTDSQDYTVQVAGVTLVVNRATLTITPNPATKVFGTANPTFTGTVTGLVPGDTISIGYTSSATTTTPVGVYSSGPDSISYTSSGPVNELGYYNFVASLGALTITQATSGVSVSCSPNPITYGTQTTLCTAAGLPADATGTIVWTINGGAWTTTPVTAPTAGGFAGYAVGSYTIGVAYSGDSNYTGASSSTTLTIQKATPTLSWGPLPNMTYGAPLGAAQLNATSSVPGTFVYTPAAGTLLPVGSYVLNATFTPTDSADYNSGAISTPLTVVKVTTSIDIFCTPNPITYGAQTTTCTAAISPLATGSVNFLYNGTGWAANVPISGGAASVSGLSNMPAGTYTIVANYGGDSNFNPSSNSTTVAIVSAPTTTTITSSLNPSTLGQKVSWPCSVTSPDGTPTGMISYTLDGNPLGTIATTDAPWSGSALTIGTHVLGCSYAAQGGFAASSGTMTQTVGIAPTVTELSSSANPTVFGGSATFTALVDTGGSIAPTASVAFTSNGTAIGSAPVSTVTTTNLLNNSDVSTWSTGSSPTLAANGGAAPDGTLTATHVVFPANVGCCINIGMTSSVAWIPGDTYTYSVWLRSDSSASVNVSLRTGAGGETDTVPTMTPTWTRYSVSGTVPAGATGNVNVLIYLADTPGADFYAWGGQVEQAATAGPYVSTSGAPATGTGGVATLTTTTLPAGSDTIIATYGGDAGTTPSTSNPLIEVVTSASPLITWNNPAPIVYGTPLSSTQLNATTSIPGTFTYSPVAGTVLAAGTQTLSVTFAPTDSADYATQVATVTLIVNQATLTITPNPASKVYGTTNPVFTGTVTGLVPGDNITVGYTSAATTTTTAGVYSSGPDAISSTTSGPVNVLGNYIYVQPLGTLTITQATTVLTWANPAAIMYGTPLSGTELNASSGGVAGTFTYTPAVGTVLAAGPQTLSVTFTPTDGADYSTASATVTLTVNKAALTVTPNPASKVFGTANPAFTGSITGLVDGDVITATYASAATTSTGVGVYSSGVNAIAATLSDPGTKLGNYTLTQTLGALTITQATPVLTWATPAAITYGTSLSATQLDATAGGVAGTFVYAPAVGTVLAAGSQTLSVTFTPTDLADYTVQTATVTLLVNKAALTVTPNSASRLYGVANPAFTGTITGMIPGDGISATYASGANGTTTVGVYSTGVNAIASTMVDPSGKLGNYSLTQNLGALTITQVTTVLTWPTPAAIAYGAPLSGVQLNAASGGVAGSFVYTPSAGTVLSAGTHTLNVTFTPTDGADYSTATASVNLTVNPAILTVTPAPSSKVYGTANPAFTGLITGMISGDGISASYSSAATTITIVGVYSSGPNAIVATLSDPGSKLSNYTVNQTVGTLTITQATTVLTWATPAPVTYETALSATQLDATSGGVAGTFTYTPIAGTILGAGSHVLSVEFTPTDAVDYTSASATVTLTVNKATPSVTLMSSLNPASYGSPVTFTAQTAAAATGSMTYYDGGTIIATGTISGGLTTYTTNALGTATHNITASYGGDSNYLPAVSAVLPEVIVRTSITLTITSSASPSNYGDLVTFTITATGVPGLAIPTGVVVLTDGVKWLASPPLDASGQARFSTVSLLSGSHALTAVYGGDVNYK